MMDVWWGKESGRGQPARLVPGQNLAGMQPELLPSASRAVEAEVRERIKSYTREWTNLRTTDAGIALVRLFGEQMEPGLKRLNRLPEKALVEFLTTAGVQLLPPTPAAALLEFEVAEGAPDPVLIGRGFQVGAQPASGSGDLVVFETERTFFAAPAKIAELHVQQGSLFQQVDLESASDAAPFLPFGKKPVPGRALFIGLSGTVTPGPTLNIGIGVAAPPGSPPPVPSGGLLPLPVPPPPLLRWEVLDSASYEPAEVVRDETGGLARSGIVELRLPRRWRIGPRPEGLPGDEPLRWLRLRIVHGQYPEPPKLSFVRLNMARAFAVRTIRNEVLEPVPNSRGRRMRLSQTPILPGSLVLEVDDGTPEFEPVSAAEAESISGLKGGETTSTQAQPSTQRWREVEDLLGYGSQDLVYVLDPLTGELTFGDGVQGALLPEGFRNVRAVSYRVGGGAAGAADAEAVSTPLSSVPFVTSVKNPFPATGGTDRESQPQALRRGPQEIRARGRSVTVADYALLAARAPGAQVQRAHAISGRHPAYPGQPIPGVVGVFIVPPDRGEGPPTPDQAALRAVARYLSKEAAPAGIEVVVAAPRYHKIRAEVAAVIRSGADAGETVRRVIERVNQYLHPTMGGDDGQGWPFGGTLRYPILLRLLTSVDGISAISRLNVVVDGFRIRACTDYTIAEDALFWPEGHQVIVLETEEGS